MNRILAALHVLDAALGLALILVVCMTSDEVPMSWFSVIILDGVVALAMFGELPIHPCAYALRVLWVGMCYVLEMSVRCLDSEVLTYGGAVLVAYAFALSVALLRLKRREAAPQGLREVIVKAEPESLKVGEISSR
jgi:hypothetical protein